MGYSSAQPAIFKTGQLMPVKDLKLLVKDYAVRAKAPTAQKDRTSTDVSAASR